MTHRFTLVDELTRSDHHYLTADCSCRYLCEYTARGSYTYSDSNQQVMNFKKPIRVRDTPQWQWKGQAINTFANTMAQSIDPNSLDGCVFVPVPPSKISTHPEYDDRILQLLTGVRDILGNAVHVEELVEQTENLGAAHEQNNRRLTPDEQATYYKVRPELLDPHPNKILIVDDVITTGSHFVAMRQVLSQHYPHADYHGLFIARTVRDADIGFDPL